MRGGAVLLSGLGAASAGGLFVSERKARLGTDVPGSCNGWSLVVSVCHEVLLARMPWRRRVGRSHTHVLLRATRAALYVPAMQHKPAFVSLNAKRSSERRCWCSNQYRDAPPGWVDVDGAKGGMAD